MINGEGHLILVAVAFIF